jgi:WhiB family redox-sensing transcriptional regulator
VRIVGDSAPLSIRSGKAELTADAQAMMMGIFDLGYEKYAGEELHWQEFALCAQTDPDIFFPEKGGSTAPATSVCSACAVQSECLEYAISHDIRHGIWGGMSDNDRRRISRERRRARRGA